MSTFFKDLKVIELASVLAGPSVGQFFAELGAQVIKIENPTVGGDVTRSWKLSSEPKESTTPAYFCSANWGKEFESLNIKKEKDLQSLYNLVKTADVVITSYKPGDDHKLKVDYDTLSKLNNKLIYGHITGYGEDSPRAGYDAIIQAESGFMYMNGEPDTPPTKMPVAMMDVLTAHQLKEGILVALINRQHTGKGDYIGVNLFQSGVSSLVNQGTNFLQANHIPKQMGSEHPNIVPYGKVFYSKDELPLVLAVGSDKQFAHLCDLLEIEIDSSNQTNYLRVQNREHVYQMLADKITNFERKEFLVLCEKLFIPAGAVNDMKNVFEYELAKELVLEDENLKGIRNIAFKMKNHPLTNTLKKPM